MALYCVNRNAQYNGDHEVHKEGCSFWPEYQNRHELGYFDSCRPAVVAAKKVYSQSNGCKFCSPSCHTS